VEGMEVVVPPHTRIVEVEVVVLLGADLFLRTVVVVVLS